MSPSSNVELQKPPGETIAACTILQAYQADTRPFWIDLCMASVRGWAARNGHDYVFTDRFFDPVPAWFRQRCGPEIGPMTDLARTILMQSCLDRGSTAVCWIDADVVIFQPDSLHLPPITGLTAIREMTPLIDCRGNISIDAETVNGALLAAQAGCAALDAYRQAIEQRVATNGPGELARTCVGPMLLTALAEPLGIAVIDNVGLITPGLGRELLRGEGRIATAYLDRFGSSLYAANLCHFARGETDAATLPLFDQAMALLVALLCESNGAAINRYLPDHHR